MKTRTKLFIGYIVIFFILLVLKLFSLVTWPWWIVTIPLWSSVVIVCYVILNIITNQAIMDYQKSKRGYCSECARLGKLLLEIEGLCGKDSIEIIDLCTLLHPELYNENKEEKT